MPDCTGLRFSRTCRNNPHTDQAHNEYYQAAARPHPQTNFREGRDAQTKNNQDDSQNLSPAVWATINDLESQIVPPFCELFDNFGNLTQIAILVNSVQSCTTLSGALTEYSERDSGARCFLFLPASVLVRR